ncbi:MAG: AraC family transcriptional regulator [Burkholderiales bacterium]|nr:helix-turn-helix transcriptional regulator [Burkholderiales bacterium]MDE1925557.1 AraC family transcriptional regulator [Burkholderiales bacterium]MDE2157730.1 AraC family transcriptional regulator [Burkholderiales bacterium]MDE2503282.1 AraC family transcriptional regulator [Burkholderiales bacterium]
MERDTVSMHFVGAAMARLDRAARERVMRSAGIPKALLAAPHSRVTAQSFSALWLAVSRELDDEFFGLDSRRMKVGSFALLSHAVLGSAHLDRALKQMLRGFDVLLDDVHGELHLEGGDGVVTIANRIEEPAARRFADETFLVMVHGLACWLAGRRIPLASAAFAYPRPDHAGEYTTMYSQHLTFDAPGTAIRFDASLLGLPVVQGPQTLKTFLRKAPQSVFLKYKNEASVTARLRRRLRRCLGQDEWPVLEAIAGEFNVSPTTLRRRLEAESTTYQAVKDDVRRDAAVHYLCSTGLSVPDIAALVGFQEPSAFRRAFKTWSGIQPGEYRMLQSQAVGGGT